MPGAMISRRSSTAKELRGGSYVGIWWPRGLALTTAILGILKSGAAYVPLYCEMPADRVITVMEEVNANALIADQQLGVRLMPGL